jgi:site-specific recombinase XerD
MGEAFTPQAVTPTDVREYRQYLLNVRRQKANTLNRKLTALAIFMQFAIDNNLIEHDPTAAIKSIKDAPRGLRHLDKQ